MPVTITRTPWIDDDGTGTSGTVLNNAMKTGLYNEIDAALAKCAQLAGGNTFTGNQTITQGALVVTAVGTHAISGTGVGLNVLQIANLAAGTSNGAQLLLGNDASTFLTALSSFASNYVPTVPYNIANASTLAGTGVNGLAIATSSLAPMRFYTNGAERARIASSGEVLINLTTNPGNGQLMIAGNLGVVNCLSLQNTNVSNTGFFQGFFNSVLGLAGGIAQSAANAVTFNTTSDQRLKTDVGRATDLRALRAVVVHDFTWTADGVRDRGVFAQETHALYPRAVTEGTDETTESGSLARPWMTDYSKFVPDLIVGWQQHDAAIAELRAALAAAKG